jgi:formylglycine-generating enzyme required for sulfatase activity
MKKLIFTVLFAFIGAFAFSQERIAVFPFEDRSNLFTRDELDSFYREFSNEFKNKTDDSRFTVINRQEVEKLINMEAAFQLSDYSSKEKTAEMNRVLNAKQILHGIIIKVDNTIRITVSRYTFPDLEVLRGGATVSITNRNQLFDKIPELVQMMMRAMTGGGNPPGEGPAPEKFVRIEGGTFTMGSPANEPERTSDEVQHQVTVRSFYMGKYQVTQAEYETVMGTNPSYFQGSNLPVENVSWYDAIEYCNRLSQREELSLAYTIDKNRSDPNNTSDYDDVRWLVTWNPNANGYRLPTEAEWEYACRAGTTTPFSTGNNITTSNANYNGNYPYNNKSKGTYRERTTAVGSFAPNPWGLYDMHGNVYEWCWDWYGSYSSGAQTDPRGAVSGYYRVGRGGYWSGDGRYLRSASRLNNNQSSRGDSTGFRLVRP